MSIRCSCCGRFGRHKAFTMCVACYQRWDRAGRPDTGPPPRTQDPVSAAAAGRRAAKQARMEDYQELRSWGETREQAAARLGVCTETTRRYDRALREQVTASGPNRHLAADCS